jgi:hypothetical protein
MQIAISNELLLVFAIALILVIILIALIPAARGKREVTHAGEPTVVDFPDKHVHVSVPWQGYGVQVRRIPYQPLAELPRIEVAGQPWPYRTLLNVVIAREDDTDVLVTEFEPPLTLKMAYSAEDLSRAQEFKLEHPVFGFWDGCQWVLFTEEKHKLSYEENPNPTREVAGYAVVELAMWNDPAIGNGP